MTPNPKIQELIKSLGIIPEDEHYDVAEAVIRECADIAKHHVMNISTYADADFVEKQIKEHFGVADVDR